MTASSTAVSHEVTDLVTELLYHHASELIAAALEAEAQAMM